MPYPRILVVDNDEAILDSLRRALELEGYAVRTLPRRIASRPAG